MNDIFKKVVSGIIVFACISCFGWVYQIKQDIDQNNEIDKQSIVVILSIVDKDYSELVSKIDMYTIEMQTNGKKSISKNKDMDTLGLLNLQKKQLENYRASLTKAFNN